MDSTKARQSLALIDEILKKTQQHLDPHAFHFVHWGLIVLVWYPLANYFQLQGDVTQYISIGIASTLLGISLSVFREMKLSKAPRLLTEDTFLTKQVCILVYSVLAAAIILSIVAPANNFIHGRNVPILWGFSYAIIAFMMGVLYEKDFLISGIAIFFGCVLAIFFQEWNGYILGPFMGLGLAIPGMRAEGRVSRLLEQDLGQQSE